MAPRKAAAQLALDGLQAGEPESDKEPQPIESTVVLPRALAALAAQERLKLELQPHQEGWVPVSVRMACGHVEDLGRRSPEWARFLERSEMDSRCGPCIISDNWSWLEQRTGAAATAPNGG